LDRVKKVRVMESDVESPFVNQCGVYGGMYAPSPGPRETSLVGFGMLASRPNEPFQYRLTSRSRFSSSIH
jgi:hypothetical protein